MIYLMFFRKIYQYSPSDSTKQYEKGCNKRSTAKFNPKATLQRMKENIQYEPRELNDKTKLIVIEEYLDVSSPKNLKNSVCAL